MLIKAARTFSFYFFILPRFYKRNWLSWHLIDLYRLIMDWLDEGSDGNDSEDHLERCDDSNLSGSEQSEGKLYFLTSLGQHEEGGGGGGGDGGDDKPVEEKKKVRRRRNRGDLLRALSVAWDKERGNGRSTIRKTLLPVSCPVCFKVLSNAYNLKVHMSIHDGLNHQCSICGHTSKSRDALRKHLAYRHLIGQSGPVRPRQPTTKRRRGRGQLLFVYFHPFFLLSFKLIFHKCLFLSGRSLVL